MNEQLINEQLRADEEVVFSATPEKKLFTRNELIRIPISFFLIGIFIVYYCFFAEIDTTVLLITLAVAIAFIVYNTVIKTYIKTAKRRNTIYVITCRRILFILSNGKGKLKKCITFNISGITASAIDMNKDETGSVLFSETREIETYPLKIGNNWISYPGGVVPIFFDILDPTQANDTYIELKQRLSPQQSESNDELFSMYDE
ncbi:MAG: hypothetical protein FWG21_05290 [Oscillospiraceae bacterium]|nr:hypothetical protein [Oscillospiraceae bacterium]